MWPWGHLAVGYLVYAAYSRYDGNRTPGGDAVLALALGTQFPDLVDKPLAWHLGVIPNGRSLAHSLLVAVVVCALIGLSLRRWSGTTTAIAFGMGYGLHLFADALYPILTGRFAELAFLAWPMIPAVQHDSPGGILTYIVNLQVTPFVAFEFLLTAVAAVVWYVDGRPGLAAVGGWLVRRVTSSRS